MVASDSGGECSGDPRARRTRQLLHQALLSLLREKNFEALSVQHITERATVNRATFYDHFSDKFALFDDLVAENFRAVLRARFPKYPELSPAADTLPRLLAAVCHFLSLLPADCDHSANHKLLDLLTEATVKSILRALLIQWLENSGRYPARATLELTATMASAALCTAGFAWSKQPQRPPPDEYAQTILPWVPLNLPPPY